MIALSKLFGIPVFTSVSPRPSSFPWTPSFQHPSPPCLWQVKGSAFPLCVHLHLQIQRELLHTRKAKQVYAAFGHLQLFWFWNALFTILRIIFHFYGKNLLHTTYSKPAFPFPHMLLAIPYLWEGAMRMPFSSHQLLLGVCILLLWCFKWLKARTGLGSGWVGSRLI